MLFPLHVMPSHFKPSPHDYCVCLVAASLPAALIHPLTRGTTANPNRSHRLWHTDAFKMQNESMLKPAAWGKLSGCHSACGSSAVQKMVYQTWGRRQTNVGTQSILELDTCNPFLLKNLPLSPWGQDVEVARRRKPCSGINFCFLRIQK